MKVPRMKTFSLNLQWARKSHLMFSKTAFKGVANKYKFLDPGIVCSYKPRPRVPIHERTHTQLQEGQRAML